MSNCNLKFGECSNSVIEHPKTPIKNKSEIENSKSLLSGKDIKEKETGARCPCKV
jgi:hypothetical protein